MSRTVAEKMGLKAGTRAILVGAPDEATKAMKLPDLEQAPAIRGTFGYIHIFVRTQAEMRHQFAKAKRHLAEGGMLWVSWPKGRRDGTDLTMQEVIRIGYDLGLVESIGLGVDETWAGLKFTWPKAGKVYRNSSGTLKAA